jgi:integrase
MLDYRLGKLKGEFCAVWYEGGKRRRYRLGTRDPREARATLREFIGARERAGQSAGRQLTVADIWKAYLDDRKAEHKVAVPRMVDAWKRLAPHFGNLDPADCSPRVVREYIRKRRASGISDGTIHTEVGYLRSALRRVLGEHNAPNITLPPKPRPRSRFLSATEARRLIDASPPMSHVRLYILLALHTAGRPSAILDLEWNRVDFDAGTIELDNPARDRTPKGRACVPMAPQLRQPLADAKSQAVTGYVIEHAGHKVASIKKGIAGTAQRAGLTGVTPYVLRHSAARFMVEAGIDMEVVSQYLGHTTTKVTEGVYGRFSPKGKGRMHKASKVIADQLYDVDEND